VVKAEVKEAIFRTMLRVHSSVNAGICPAFQEPSDDLRIPEFLWDEFGLEREPPEDGGDPGVVRFEYGYSKPLLCRDLAFGLGGIEARLRFGERGWYDTFVPWGVVVEFFSLDKPPCAIMLSVSQGQVIVPPRPPATQPDPPSRPTHLKLVD
jgi:hypothetical protein